MKKHPVKHCDHCGAKMVEYPHVINKPMIRVLAFMYENRGLLKMNETEGIGVTFNQKNNFQKMQYWGLIGKYYDESGDREGGTWAITQLGIGFIEGTELIHKKVWTYRNKFVRFDEERIGVKDVDNAYWRQREHYSAEAKPHYVDNDGQLHFPD